MDADYKKTIAFLEQQKSSTDRTIKELLNLDVPPKRCGIIEYQMALGGKRLRPALAIIACRMFGGKIHDVLYPAAGAELIHNYSLIIDDIIDNGILRRGRPTVWAKYGKSIAECVAIDYAAAIFQAANRSVEPVKISELFAKTLKILVEGEILDILFEQRGREQEHYVIKNRYKNIKENDYFKMVHQKTAALFQASCEVGGICARAAKNQIAVLRRYGFNLGVTFQIQDDILDLFGDQRKFGKKIGKDIQERKGGNIVILYALKELSLNDKNRLQNIFKKEKILDSDIRKGMSLIEKTDALQKSIVLKQKYLNKTKQNLKTLPKNQWRSMLGKIADFVAERDK